ncbi:UMP-CMP kinase 2, mitochondrial-like [Diabrotica undecimpunctata]|uniref:UMP-CMP kinase 2, mitochondrial-like n=1 Tax=Diabrotica undecimpunctata TaxID=50387 RepID=UPI003B6363F5
MFVHSFSDLTFSCVMVIIKLKQLSSSKMSVSVIFVALSLTLVQTKGFVTDRGCPAPKVEAQNNDSIKTPFPLIYPDADSMLTILRLPQFSDHEGVQGLLRLYEKGKEKKAEFQRRNYKKNHPLIVLEGLAGSGKSTLVSGLSKKINGVQSHSPSSTVETLKDKFVNNPLLDNIYHRFAHYITAMEVYILLKDSPVVLDRYWHSSATYSIARAVYNTNGKYILPPKGDKVYNWPDDLLKPDVVLYLEVDEDVREKRLYKRGKQNDDTALNAEEREKIEKKFGKNEKLLQRCPEYRNNMILAYKNMANPEVTMLNANLSIDEVLNEAYQKVAPLLKQ